MIAEVQHLALLFDAMRPGERIEIRPLSLHHEAMRRTFTDRIDRAIDLVRAAIEHRDDVYVGVQPRSRAAGTADAVTRFAWMVADVDYGTHGHKRPGPHATREDALRAIDALGIVPTILLCSGGGFQPWYRVTGEVTIAEAYEEAGKRLAYAVGGDNIYDPPRILRVAGSQNHKLSTPRPVTIEALNGDVAHPLRTFLDLPAPPLPSLASPDAPSCSERVTSSYSGPKPFSRANAVPMLSVLEFVGAKKLHKVSGVWFCVCPIHGSGNNPRQFSVGTTSNVARCWGDCSRTFTPVDVVAGANGIEPRDAVNVMARQFGFEGFPPKRDRGEEQVSQ